MPNNSLPKYKEYQYERAPLQEAIFEAKFSYENFDGAFPGQFYERVREQFPDKRDLSVITVVLGTSGVQSGVDIPSSRAPQAPTMQLWAKEKDKLLQVGPGIVTANSIRYGTWDTFLPAIELGLNTYLDLARPVKTTRIGARYINRFLLELEEFELSKYFRLGLSAPDTLHDAYAFEVSLMKRIRNTNEQVEHEIRTRFCTDALRPGEQGIAVVLDIDCYTLFECQAESQLLLRLADYSHSLIGQVFESLLQDKLRTVLGGKPK